MSSPLFVAIAFFAVATLTVSFARFSGGVAMVWLAGALLAGRLTDVPERRWGPWLVLCGLASVMATGFFGIGWAASVPLAIINIAEAAGAAFIWRRITRAFWPDETLEWLVSFYIGIGLTLPLLSGGSAALVAWLTNGLPPMENFTHWIIGHSLGMIACLPLFRFFFWRMSRGRSFLPSADRWPLAILMFGTFSLLTIAVFLLDMRALLVFPLLFIVVGAAVLEQSIIALLPVLLIAIGGTMTALEFGPIAVMDFEYGDRMQFFELYVAVAVLGALPVSIERQRRMIELRQMRQRIAKLEEQGASAY
ncbi:MASE1 domain-containing protein [Novosphingobium sp. SL115]|uniref:MASE1 domain-containing protein n=1 Tax=Novosphingobium sp. SL115 TaxID=2995150 RepID=UPI002273990C|nr:MASE1 domain-containing protein [Novosphingobium sp. SL115]MCY1671883.1 MASE1 domain-containing protein [Novosphingobium sp. SL115]